MSIMARNKFAVCSSTTLAALVIVTALCALLPPSAADASQSTWPALPNDAGVPRGNASGPSATQPAATTALPPSTEGSASSAATASKKFPLPTPGGEPYLPAVEVASALPVPTPDELPSAASLGFGGPGDECCGGGGYGWFGRPGGFGPGTYGYNGPLYFGAAPAGVLGNVGAANVLVPLLVACVCAAMFV